MVPLAEHSIVQTVKLQQLTKNTEKYNTSFKSKTHSFVKVFVQWEKIAGPSP